MYVNLWRRNYFRIVFVRLFVNFDKSIAGTASVSVRKYVIHAGGVCYYISCVGTNARAIRVRTDCTYAMHHRQPEMDIKTSADNVRRTRAGKKYKMNELKPNGNCFSLFVRADVVGAQGEDTSQTSAERSPIAYMENEMGNILRAKLINAFAAI